MSAVNNSLLLTAPAGGSGARSLRFSSPDSSFLSRTPASASNRKTWTWAGWVKRSALGSAQGVFEAGTGAGTDTYAGLSFTSSNQIFCGFANAGSNDTYITTSAVYRDCSAWYHIVLAIDTTNATSTDRIKLWVNGERITTFADSAYGAQNTDSIMNTTNLFVIGQRRNGSNLYFSGYLADIHFIDGQALDPSSFTTTDLTTGQLIPKAYTGSYGTNGFKLNFSDNSTTAALGTDTSGNGNTWTVNNLSVTAGSGNDSLVETPTSYGTDTGAGGEVRGNYATLNPLDNGGITLSNGNIDWAGNGAGTKVSYGTVAVSSGKWYFEASINGATGGVNWECGIARVGTANNSRPGATANGWQVSSSSTTTLFKNNSGSSTSIYSSGLSNGDILSVAFDVDNGRIWFARNGTWLEGSPSAGTGASFTNVSGTVAPFGGSDGSGPSSAMNFGQRAFAYTAPSGFKALCDTNLPAPVVAKPNTVMDVVTYTGNATYPRTITGLNFSPDFIWTKIRSLSYRHMLADSVRGTARSLTSNDTNAESVNDAYGSVSSFDSAGWSIQSGSVSGENFNQSGQSYVAWAWDAGTSTVSNTAGSITSQVRANASAGFSVCTFTSPASGGWSWGHGLNVAPQLVMMKPRSTTGNWQVYHSGLTKIGSGAKFIWLNSTSAEMGSTDNYWTPLPTSSVVTTGSGLTPGSNIDLVAYCFSPVSGYSSFGSYTGNGSADGPFVFCNFRPRWVMVKRTDSTSNWTIWDAARDTYNYAGRSLYPNLSNAEDANTPSGGAQVIDILSNGFKLRDTGGSGQVNASGGTYIFASFAESPFQYARAR